MHATLELFCITNELLLLSLCSDRMAARPQNVFRGWLQMACPMQVIGFRKVELRLREEADQV